MNTTQRRLASGLMTAASLAAATDIRAPGPQGPLQGTLLAASSAHRTAALIIPGSGPTDRNGNSPRGLHTDTYRLLAEGLASHGISSVRIDKRGMYGSAAASPDARLLLLDQTSHTLKLVASDDRTGNLQTYTDPTRLGRWHRHYARHKH
ncbi:hypothetical protein THUN1379_20460 [Paludibacterium sp. THUN1379]|uniref:hypothetical protein n=1 Tax=Paludibacterium sp. THUN1379 TaxID=3112107 RepID=UPI00308D0C04|nr:hypothetical protein THUN1379_20460 [Paludibacterium sp. THUN1379]